MKILNVFRLLFISAMIVAVPMDGAGKTQKKETVKTAVDSSERNLGPIATIILNSKSLVSQIQNGKRNQAEKKQCLKRMAH